VNIFEKGRVLRVCFVCVHCDQCDMLVSPLDGPSHGFPPFVNWAKADTEACRVPQVEWHDVVTALSSATGDKDQT
jgi:hypothetical protein